MLNKKTICRKEGSGHKSKFNTSINRQKVFKLFNHKWKMSLSKMSKKLGCSISTIRNILKNSKKPVLNYKRKKGWAEHLYNVFSACQKC